MVDNKHEHIQTYCRTSNCQVVSPPSISNERGKWSKLLERVHGSPASPAHASWVQPPGVHCFFLFLLLLIFNKTLILPFHATSLFCLLLLPELPPVWWLAVPQACLDLQPQHHPSLHRLADAASPREKETSKREKKKTEWGRERQTEWAAPPEKRGIILPRHRGIHLPSRGSPSRTCSIWSQGGTLCGQKGNKDYAAGIGGAGDDLPQLHGSQRCSQAL